MKQTLLLVLLTGVVTLIFGASSSSLSQTKEVTPPAQISPYHQAILDSLNSQTGSARLPTQPENESWRMQFNGSVKDLIPLSAYSGVAVPVDFDPRFALSVQISRCFPKTDEIKDGEIVTFAIHSPTRLFGPKSPKGLIYAFTVTRVMRGRHPIFSDLHPWRSTQNPELLATTDDETGVTYSVQKDGRHVVAASSDGKTIWRRDPFVEAKLEPYRSERPIISFIQLMGDGTEKSITIVFDSSQFGSINPKTGDFNFHGQD